MMRFVVVLCVIGALGARTGMAAPQAEPTSAQGKLTAPAAVLRDDARLQTKVSLSLKDRPLREALAALSKQVQVPLSASAETAEDKVTLFFTERPAVEVLSLLAGHFHFRWFRQFRGYEMRQDAAERARETAQREGDLKAEWEEVQAWVERLARLGGTPRAELEVRTQEVAKRLGDTHLDAAERSRLTAEGAALADALRTDTATAVTLLRGLTPAQVAQLRQDDFMLLSRQDGSLPPGVPVRTRKEDTSRDAPSENPRTRALWADAELRLDRGWYFGGSPRPVERRSQLGVGLFVRLEGVGKLLWDTTYWYPHLPAKERPAAGAAETQDAALLRPVDLGDVQAPRRSVPGAGRGPSALTQGADRWPAWPRLGDVLEALHQATGLEILADSFARCRVDPKWRSGRQPVARLLETLARELDYTWRKEGNLLLLRSRCYHWDRAVEVPEGVLRPWQERAARPGGSSLDTLAALVAVLDDLQVLGLSQYWGWYLEDPWIAPVGITGSEIYQRRRHLRFWATLNPAQRQAALSGATVTTEQMNPTQRRAFVTALTDPAKVDLDSFGYYLAGEAQPVRTVGVYVTRPGGPS
jgi:hypothetical protein